MSLRRDCKNASSSPFVQSMASSVQRLLVRELANQLLVDKKRSPGGYQTVSAPPSVSKLEMTHLLFVQDDPAGVASTLADHSTAYLELVAGLEPRWSVVHIYDGDHDGGGGGERDPARQWCVLKIKKHNLEPGYFSRSLRNWIKTSLTMFSCSVTPNILERPLFIERHCTHTSVF